MTTPTLPEIRISAHDAVELLEAVVVEVGPDFVYEMPDGKGCVYVHDGRCSCLIARALHLAGLTVAELAALDALDYTFIGAMSSWVLPDRVTISSDARKVLGAAQRAQDIREPWGVALQAARDVLKAVA